MHGSPQTFDAPVAHPLMPLQAEFVRARKTHNSSQLPSQQNGSSLQTAWQQVESLQAGLPLISQQAPLSKSPHDGAEQTDGIDAARFAQEVSQLVRQQ